ncbi:MAG: hypothetical protein K2L11_00965 [Muribaculaceae bacterium]|nr:hypothetical protein [Muribaculaceae bacterium]
MRHSEAEGAEARSLRSALREWGSFGRGVVLLDGKGGGSTLIGCGLRPAGGADVAGWNADFSLVFINASYLVIGLADADSWLSPASPL